MKLFKEPTKLYTEKERKMIACTKFKNNKTRMKQKEKYLGHCLTPSCVSLSSGGFLSILIPSFSIVMLSARTETTLLFKEGRWRECLCFVVPEKRKDWFGDIPT